MQESIFKKLIPMEWSKHLRKQRGSIARAKLKANVSEAVKYNKEGDDYEGM